MNTKAIEDQARGMTTAQLRRAYSWEETLCDHYAETGHASGNSVAAQKKDIIEAEMRRRGERL